MLQVGDSFAAALGVELGKLLKQSGLRTSLETKTPSYIGDWAFGPVLRKAISDYQKALKPHQQTLKQAAGANAKAQRTGIQDTKQQDNLDRQKANQKQRLAKAAQSIIDRRNEKARVAKMSPKERAAYGKQKSAAAKAKREAREAKILKEAGKK